jgi:hypothetical protein
MSHLTFIQILVMWFPQISLSNSSFDYTWFWQDQLLSFGFKAKLLVKEWKPTYKPRCLTPCPFEITQQKLGSLPQSQFQARLEAHMAKDFH